MALLDSLHRICTETLEIVHTDICCLYFVKVLVSDVTLLQKSITDLSTTVDSNTRRLEGIETSSMQTANIADTVGDGKDTQSDENADSTSNEKPGTNDSAGDQHAVEETDNQPESVSVVPTQKVEG